jgi:hypothetical protein
MDAIEILMKAHRAAKLAMQAVALSEGPKRRTMFLALKADLLAHDRLEEDVFYPAMASHPKAAGAGLRDKAAHAEVEKALEALTRMAPDDAAWPAAFKAMQERLLAHITDEEQHLFPQARAAFSEAEMTALSIRMSRPQVRAGRVA